MGGARPTGRAGRWPRTGSRHGAGAAGRAAGGSGTGGGAGGAAPVGGGTDRVPVASAYARGAAEQAA
ncbi:hypothetical protein, partial [Streptomyces sp. NPDC003090]|uniref:hypothetical protein n=1 Tax=Streptomyces sp. NPDC003090 TaxID=3154274 RepID=UPI0038021791